MFVDVMKLKEDSYRIFLAKRNSLKTRGKWGKNCIFYNINEKHEIIFEEKQERKAVTSKGKKFQVLHVHEKIYGIRSMSDFLFNTIIIIVIHLLFFLTQS